MIDVKVTNYAFYPEYSEVYMDSNMFENNASYPYKVGNSILCYDASVNTPKEIQIHALISSLENYLNTSNVKKQINK